MSRPCHSPLINSLADLWLGGKWRNQSGQRRGAFGSTLGLLAPLLRVVRAQETASLAGTPIALPGQACVDFMGPYLR